MDTFQVLSGSKSKKKTSNGNTSKQLDTIPNQQKTIRQKYVHKQSKMESQRNVAYSKNKKTQ